MQRRPLLAACKKALPFVAESGSAFSYLLLLKFYGLRNSHSRHFVTDYAVLIGKRLCVIAAGENCRIGLIFIIFRFPGVRLIRRGRGIERTGPIEGFGVSVIRYPIHLNGVSGNGSGLPCVLCIAVCLLPFSNEIGRSYRLVFWLGLIRPPPQAVNMPSARTEDSAISKNFFISTLHFLVFSTAQSAIIDI